MQQLTLQCETEYKLDGVMAVTACPFGMLAGVGGNMCHHCLSFISDDEVKQVVSCKGDLDGIN